MEQTIDPKTMQDKIPTTHPGVTKRLAGRVQELETRYADPLPELEDEVDKLSNKVGAHFSTMGVA